MYPHEHTWDPDGVCRWMFTVSGPECGAERCECIYTCFNERGDKGLCNLCAASDEGCQAVRWARVAPGKRPNAPSRPWWKPW